MFNALKHEVRLVASKHSFLPRRKHSGSSVKRPVWLVKETVAVNSENHV
jgi:hypothetical protein